MRFDTPVYFQTIESTYDPATGNYGEDTITEVKKNASVSDTGDEVLRLIYGELKQDSLVIRLQNHYTAPFDRIRIGNKKYAVDKARRLRVKHVFIVSEVQ